MMKKEGPNDWAKRLVQQSTRRHPEGAISVAEMSRMHREKYGSSFGSAQYQVLRQVRKGVDAGELETGCFAGTSGRSERFVWPVKKGATCP